MKIKMFQVDAFTSELFSGNPAAVCLLDEWLSDELMLSISAENNLSETAFLNLSNDPKSSLNVPGPLIAPKCTGVFLKSPKMSPTLCL